MMKLAWCCGLVLSAGWGVSLLAAQEAGSLRPVPFNAVQINDEFWAPRLKTAIHATLPHCFKECEETGRLRNFDKAAGKLQGEFEGYFFNDSDVYKVIEGAAYALMHERDPQLEAYVDEQIARIAAAQQKDGYLNTYYTLKPDEQRWSNIRDRHELYCAGHLIEAGIAYYQATGKRSLLDVAIRFADYIDSVFGSGKDQHVPGHEELELALIKLYHLTHEARYLDLARFFIEQRGNAEGHKLYGEYAQDHAPVREHRLIVGHAVRGMYLYSGVADLAALDHDPGLIAALDRIWDDTIDTKWYVTGGLGSSSHNEGFTEAYDLPNETAYCETCASIALCFWAQRLNLLHADAQYVDVLERALYNSALAGISLDGTTFFYENPLASRGDHHRQPWYSCACCPTNMVRFLPSVGGYIYAYGDDSVYVNLYVSSTTEVPLADKRTVGLTQATRYPWDGAVRLTLRPATPAEFTLALRIPAWCQGATVRVNGEPVTPLTMDKGYARLRRTWKAGDVVELNLPMPVARIVADPRVKADVGRVALQRGPLIYCVEDADNHGVVPRLVLPNDAKLTAEPRPDLLGGVTVLRGDALVAAPSEPAGWERPLYQTAPAVQTTSITAIPYYAWDNRAAGPMAVWLPESAALLDSGPVSWVHPSASFTCPHDTLAALHDRLEPTSSDDHRIPRFTWWPHRGEREWVQYDFDTPRRVTGVEVYWFDDQTQGGQCRTPASWRLLCRLGDEWQPVPNCSACGVEHDRYNRVTFEPLTTTGLRIEAQFQPEASAGLLEWRVDSQ